jgi:type IV pilus assembly protein PilB
MLLSDDQLKKLLLEHHVVGETSLRTVENNARNTNSTLWDALIESNTLSDEDLGIMVSMYLQLPFVKLSKMQIPEDAFHIVPERIARRQKVVAYAKDASGVKLAMADPHNTLVQEMIAKKTGLPVTAYFATDRDIYGVIRIYRRDLQKTLDKLIKESFFITGNEDNAPVGKIVDLIIDYAYQDKASDIHIEPEEKESLIRFRIDGILHDFASVPKNLHDQIITRIKVLSRLRTDEHMAPQDGKMQMKLEEENLDIRVSLVPVVEGEKAVLRLLASRFRQFSLMDLGMSKRDLQKMIKAYGRSFGMILSTGPTGSGKTTSIYSILKILNTREKNITTIEDPVEYKIKGVNQIQTNAKSDLTFASGLRSILRQDPNIVFVGEIRDNETANIAVNAALTGHLVVSTLHTNDAATALPRLTDMQVEPFLVASTVNIIVAQRLVRKICDVCKTVTKIPYQDLASHLSPGIIEKHFGTNLTEIQVYQGKGCKTCHMSGFQGRLGVFEVLEVSERIRKLIVEKNDSDVILKAAIEEGMTTMLDDGLDKVAHGLTSISEVLRVTKTETA